MSREKKLRRTDYDVIHDKKKCTICKEVFSETEFNIVEVRLRKEDGLRVAYLYSACKKCQAKTHQEYYLNSERKRLFEERKEREENKKTKICTKCGRELDKSQFGIYSYRNKEDGTRVGYLRRYCHECQSGYNSEIWQKNKPRLTSPENLAKQRANKKTKFFQYRGLNFRRSYGCEKRYTSKELALFFWHQWRRQKGLCALSGRKLTKKNAQIDHKEPRKYGTNNDFDNLQWVTDDANRAKNQMTPQEFKEFITDIYNTIN